MQENIYEIDWSGQTDWVLAESEEKAVQYCAETYGFSEEESEPVSITLVPREKASKMEVKEEDGTVVGTLTSLADDGPGPSVLASTVS